MLRTRSVSPFFNVMVRYSCLTVLDRIEERREIVADVCPSEVERNCQETQHCFALDIETEEQDAAPSGQIRSRSFMTLEHTRSAQSWHVTAGAPNRSLSRETSVVVGTKKHANYWNRLVAAKVRSAPDLLQSSATPAWLRRWCGLLACSVAQAYALSLVKMLFFPGDGPTPYRDDLLGECRLAAGVHLCSCSVIISICN